MDLVRESHLVLPFRFLRQPGPPLDDIVLERQHVPGAPPELHEVRLGAPHTADPVLDDYLVLAPVEGAALTVDRLALSIVWNVPRQPDFAAPDDLALALEDWSGAVTRLLLGRFLFYLKFRTRSIWLAHAGAPVGGHIAWRTPGGETIEVGRPPRSPLAPGRGLTRDIWERLREDMRLAREPDVHDLALFQARELLAVGMRALAVLSGAIACETKARRVLADRQARNPGGLEAPEYVKLTSRHAKIPACQVVSAMMDKVCGRNLQRERRTLYEAIERLFNVRNTVAHTGRCGWREGPGFRDADIGEIRLLLDAVEAVSAWLDGVLAQQAA